MWKLLTLSTLALVSVSLGQENEWGTVLQEMRNSMPPFHARWKVKRVIYKNPDLAELLRQDFAKRIAEAEKTQSALDVDQLKAQRDREIATAEKDQNVTFLIDATYINKGSFVIDQIFNPGEDEVAMKYHGVGPLVYRVNDRGKLIEINPEATPFLSELFRGLPFFGVGVDTVNALQKAEPTVTKAEGKSKVESVTEGVHQTFQLDDNLTRLADYEATVNGMTTASIKTSTEGSQFAGIFFPQTAAYRTLRNGKGIMLEEWSLESVEQPPDPAKFDSSIQLRPGYMIQDRTGASPVSLTSDDLLKAQ